MCPFICNDLIDSNLFHNISSVVYAFLYLILSCIPISMLKDHMNACTIIALLIRHNCNLPATFTVTCFLYTILIVCVLILNCTTIVSRWKYCNDTYATLMLYNLEKIIFKYNGSFQRGY